ncbi:MAG: hypothetical protein WD851_10540 [Pirellulales bacterium]
MSKLLSCIVPIAVLIAAVLGWKFYNKNQASDAVREQAVVLVQAFPGYEENKAYYDSAFDELHDKAFDGAYNMGGRRTSSSFDEEQYLTFLIGLFHRKAIADDKNDIAKALASYRQTLGLPIVEFGDGSTSE